MALLVMVCVLAGVKSDRASAEVWQNYEKYQIYDRIEFKDKTDGKVESSGQITAEGYVASVSDGQFRIMLKADRKDWSDGDAVKLSAELEYIGAGNSVTLEGGDPLICFYVEGTNGIVLYEYAGRTDKNTVLERGKKYVYALDGSNYVESNEDAVLDRSGKLLLPSGTYHVKAGFAKGVQNGKKLNLFASMYINVGVSGEIFTKGDNLYRTLSDEKAALIGTKQKLGTFTVPSKVSYDGESYAVTQVGDAGRDVSYIDADDNSIGWYYLGTFAGKKFSSVKIPSSVTKIEKNAFYGLDGIKNITISGKSVTIEAGAFAEAAWPQKDSGTISITGTKVTIGDRAFKGAGGMKKLVLKASASAVIGDEAFRDLKLSSISLPAKTLSIGDFAFYGSTGTVTIPSGVKTIGSAIVSSGKLSISKYNKNFSISKGALYGKKGKELIYFFDKKASSLIVSSKVSSIRPYAFYKSKLTKLTLPSTVTAVPEGMCQGASKLTSITFGKKTKSIGDAAFNGCTSLKKVSLPASLEKIGSRAFYNTKILNVTIPRNVTSLGEQLFAYYGRYVSVAFEEGSLAYEQKGNFIYERGTGRLAMAVLTQADNSTLVIPEGTKLIGRLEVINGGYLNHYVIPASVTEMDVSALRYLCDSEDDNRVEFKGYNPPSMKLSDNGVVFWCTVKVPYGAKEAYETAFSRVEQKHRVHVVYQYYE